MKTRVMITDEDESSSCNDGDIGRAISAEISQFGVPNCVCA